MLLDELQKRITKAIQEHGNINVEFAECTGVVENTVLYIKKDIKGIVLDGKYEDL